MYPQKKLVKENKKNILFICGSLELGKDGVGDYTYALSEQISSHYHSLHIIAFNDEHTAHRSSTTVKEGNITLVRISSSTNLKERYNQLKTYIATNNISFISLQFVPFSFHHKGLPFSFITKISKIKGLQWHIMFHELWVGMEKNITVKTKLLRFLQFHLIKTLIKRLKPKLIHTSNLLYIHQLKKISKASLIKELPLFGNITNTGQKTASPTSNKAYHIVLFAGIHYGAPVNDFVHWLQKELLPKECIPRFTFVGNNGPYLNEWTDVLGQNGIQYQILGLQDNDTISKLLADANLGITTTPYYLSNKSGSNAAMLEHQLAVLCVARNWIPDVDIELSFLSPKNIVQWQPQQTLDEVFTQKDISVNTPLSVGKQFISDISLWPL